MPQNPVLPTTTISNPLNPGPSNSSVTNQTAQLAAPSAAAPITWTVNANGSLTNPTTGQVLSAANTTGQTVYTTQGPYYSNGSSFIPVGSAVVSTVKSAIAASLLSNSVNVQPLTAPVAWATATTYQTGQAVTSNGNCYICLTGNTPSGATAPSGTGSAVISDGACTFYYWGPSYASNALAPVITNVNFASRYTGLFWATTSCSYAIGSSRINDSTNFSFYGCAGVDGGGSNGSYNWTQTGLIGGVSFITDAPSFQFVLSANVGPSINVYVNGVPCTLGMSVYGTGQQFFQMVFSDRRPRQITIEMQTNLFSSFYGVLCNDTISHVSAPAPPISFSLSFVGTSYLVGSGQHPVTASLGIGSQIARYLGVSNYWVDRLGSGTGYVNPGATGVFNSPNRFNAMVATNPQVLIIEGGGINDYTIYSNPANSAALASEQAAAFAYYTAVRAALPSTIILVVGSESGSTGPSAAILNMEQAVANAVAAMNDQYILYIPQSSISPNKSLVSGTGTTGATNGTGNSDVLIGPDGIHPVQLGVNEISYLIANAARKALSALN